MYHRHGTRCTGRVNKLTPRSPPPPEGGWGRSGEEEGDEEHDNDAATFFKLILGNLG